MNTQVYALDDGSKAERRREETRKDVDGMKDAIWDDGVGAGRRRRRGEMEGEAVETWWMREGIALPSRV